MSSRARRGAVGCLVFGGAFLLLAVTGSAIWAGQTRNSSWSIQAKYAAEQKARSEAQTKKLAQAVKAVNDLTKSDPGFAARLRRSWRRPGQDERLEEQIQKLKPLLASLEDIRDATIQQNWNKAYNGRNDNLFAVAIITRTLNYLAFQAAQDGSFDEATKFLGQSFTLSRVLREHPTAVGAAIGVHSEVSAMRMLKAMAERAPKDKLPALTSILKDRPAEIDPQRIWEGELILALAWFDRKQEWLLSESCTEPLVNRLDLLASLELSRSEVMGFWKPMIKKFPSSSDDWRAHLEQVKKLEDTLKNSQRGYIRRLAFDSQEEGPSTYEYWAALYALIDIYREGMVEGIERLAQTDDPNAEITIERAAPLLARDDGTWTVKEDQISITFRNHRAPADSEPAALRPILQR